MLVAIKHGRPMTLGRAWRPWSDRTGVGAGPLRAWPSWGWRPWRRRAGGDTGAGEVHEAKQADPRQAKLAAAKRVYDLQVRRGRWA